MYSADYAVARCLSVCLSVRQSVTLWYPVKTAKRVISFFSPSDSQIILVFFRTKRYGNIPTETSLTGASNARWYEKLAIFDQYLALSPKRYNGR